MKLMSFLNDSPTIGECNEDELSSFEIPSPPFDKAEAASRALHEAIADRTVVAALRGGNLRTLVLASGIVKPFAVRKLLPLLVGIESWGRDFAGPPPQKYWWMAAVQLRCSLAHMSRRREAVLSGLTDRLLLTRHEIQGMHAHYQAGGAPERPRPRHLELPSKLEKDSPENTYLRWLEQDAELAEKVADAWNAVVSRGKANVVECECQFCSPHLATSTQAQDNEQGSDDEHSKDSSEE